MPIESEHPSYKVLKPQWQRIRDNYNGSDAVKTRGVAYLPKLSDKQGTKQYNAYKLRAVYFNALERTVQGLIGAVMRIPPLIEMPKKMVEWEEDITGTGVSLNNFISYLLSEQLLMNRQGILVDYDETDKRPHAAGYRTEQITNWKADTIVLRESYQKIDESDPYLITYATQYRELYLDSENNNVYTVRIWKQDSTITTSKGDKGAWKSEEAIVPLDVGKTLETIPFIALSSDGTNLEPTTPSLIALADMTLSLYRTSADLEHGRHFTALPTAWIKGPKPTGSDNKPLNVSIGSGTVWMLPEKSETGYLEFTGQGLQSLEKAIVEKKEMLASLSSQLLQSKKTGVEAADTVRLRQNAEASTLMNTVKVVEQGVLKMLEVMAERGGINGDITVKLNTDFVDTKINSNDLTALLSAWQSGAISHDTFLYNMKSGEILEPNIDIEDEKTRIELQAGELDNN